MARAITLLLFDIALVSLAIEDFKKKKISNRYVLFILLLAFTAVFTMPEIRILARIQGMFAVSVPMLLLAILQKGSFGGGDMKLTFACGAFLGWRLLIDGVVISIFLAGIYALWLLIIRKEKRKMQFAFGPFLSIGFLIITKNL